MRGKDNQGYSKPFQAMVQVGRVGPMHDLSVEVKLTTFRHVGGHDESNKCANEAWNDPFQFALFKRSSELRRGKLRLVALSRMPRQADAG